MSACSFVARQESADRSQPPALSCTDLGATTAVASAGKESLGPEMAASWKLSVFLPRFAERALLRTHVSFPTLVFSCLRH